MFKRSFKYKLILALVLFSITPSLVILLLPERRKIYFKSVIKMNYPGAFANYVTLKDKLRNLFNSNDKALIESHKLIASDKLYKTQLIESAWHNIKLDVIPAKNYLYDYYDSNYKYLGGGYIELISDNLIIGSNGIGEMFIYRPKYKTLKPIVSNLKSIFIEQKYKSNLTAELFGRFGIKDLYYDRANNRLLVSLNVDTKKDNSCYGMGIYQSPVYSGDSAKPFNNLHFNEFFTTTACNTHFSGHASGGRIKAYKNKIIYTVGDLDHSVHGNINIPQKLNNSIGKVIAIKADGKEFDVISMGHRNQQGLVILDGKIFITEHGPQGGDEINLVSNQKHYGWPFFSYGTTYQNKELFRTTHTGPYEKPLFYFNPSIGISEIIFYQGTEFPYWRDKFIVTSLKDKSIYLLDYDSKNNSIISSERISIGHRIRDLVSLPSGELVMITDDQNIIQLSRANNHKIKIIRKIPFLRSSPSPE